MPTFRQTPPCAVVGEELGDGDGEPGGGGGEGWPGRGWLTLGPGLGERPDDGPGLAPAAWPGVTPSLRRDEVTGPAPVSRETDVGPAPPGPAARAPVAGDAGAADTGCRTGAAAGDSGPMRIDTVTKRV